MSLRAALSNADSLANSYPTPQQQPLHQDDLFAQIRRFTQHPRRRADTAGMIKGVSSSPRRTSPDELPCERCTLKAEAPTRAERAVETLKRLDHALQNSVSERRWVNASFFALFHGLLIGSAFAFSGNAQATGCGTLVGAAAGLHHALTDNKKTFIE
jgi:hypothetical protein